MAISITDTYKTITGEVLKVVGASVLNYADTGILEKTDPAVILVHCENEVGESSYWLDWQLVENVEDGQDLERPNEQQA